MEWPELVELSSKTASFRLVLKKDADGRPCIDPRLWGFSALASLDLAGAGLRRLDDCLPAAEGEEGLEPDEPAEPRSAAPCSSQGGLRCLSRLRDLCLSRNLLGPRLLPEGALHGLAALRSLDLEANCLEELPNALVSLEALTNLNVGHNRLAELPWQSLSLLPELRTLSAPYNRLTAVAPVVATASSSFPPRLTELVLRGNQLVEDGALAALGEVSSLATLDVADNSLSTLAADLALSCTKLAKLVISGNPWQDKKLAKLAEGQGDQAPAKAILELLRKGQSKRQMKASLSQAPKTGPPPPRLYRAAVEVSEEVAAEEIAAVPSSKSKSKKGKSNAAFAQPSSSSSPMPERKQVTISRDALGVRPHIVMAILHVVADVDDVHRNVPLCFFPEGCKEGCEKDFENAFEANLGLMQNNLNITPNAPDDEAAAAALAATARLQAFVAAQTRIHSAPDLGDKRRAGALGSHNAATVTWPLRYTAAPHSEVKFSPLSIGWMESKGVVTAADFAAEAAKGQVAGAPKEVAQALQRPAAALLAMPLCPHVVDSAGVVLSVHPLSNGWQTRTTAEARGALLLECSSSRSEERCRKMLLTLINDAIKLVESSDGEHERLSRRRVRVLVEPVDIVCEWDRKLRRTEFPDDSELRSLPPLPDYCGLEGGAPAAGGDRASSSSSSNSGSSSDDDSDSDPTGSAAAAGYPQAAQPKGRGRGGRRQKASKK